MTSRSYERHFVWPVALIGLGLILLLQNFGIIDWSLWEVLGRFWPVVLILIGLDMLLARTNPWLAGALAAAAILALLAAGFYGLLGTVAGTNTSSAPTQHFEQELTDQQRIEVRVQFGAGALSLRALPADSGSLAVADSSVQSRRGLSPSYRCSQGNCVLRLSGSNVGGWDFGRSGPDNWVVQLSRRVPLDMRIQSGASQLNLDLSELQLSALHLDAGASSGSIHLPTPTGTLPATIKAGAADLSVVVPAQAAARIRTNSALSTIQFDQSRFSRDGSYYVSSDYGTATNRIDLSVDAGVASVRIQ